ncbi:MAG: 2-hydroxyglutaryl-CoA dehydratase [Firmicutes bacterium]|nr:2-hydroxyglutaryl-CoA dehydratase [Bacillota bacterium]
MVKKIYTMGIDIGSTTSKTVIMLNKKEIVGQAVIPVGTGTSGPLRSIEAALKSAGIAREEVSFTVATGYGRNSIRQAQLKLSELSCHAKGAVWLYPPVRTVIDIGGQDIKVMSISEDGKLQNFVMNDKCAAGTGRFLEVMARVLEARLSDLGELDARAKNYVEISSTCTVFAESEVISRLSQGADICDLVAGIHRSVAVRVAALANRLGVVEPVFITGGVSLNSGVIRALEAELGVRVWTDARANLAGAIGAALSARP